MNKLKKFLVGATAAAIISSSTVLSAFAVGSNGSFETGDDPGIFATVTAGQTNITDWTVDSGSVDYIGTYWTASNGSRSVDLNGNETGSVSQVVTTVIGGTYTVNFDLSGNPDGGPDVKTLTVSATGTASAPYSFDRTVELNTLADMSWNPMQYVFVATTTSTTLTFASTTEGAYGPAIDNVTIEENVPTPTVTPTDTPTPTPTDTPTPTPDPFAIPAECSGITGLGAPIMGTSGSNIINGTNGNDLIFALGGSDVVDGKGGNDCIVGGNGSDLLRGGNGHDVILGGDDSDSVQGENGNDKLYGEAGSDALDGGNDSDTLSGGLGSDLWRGGNGTDNLNGGDGSDLARGDNGTDTCVAEAKLSCEL